MSPERLRPWRLREKTEGGEVWVQVTPTQLQGLLSEVFEFEVECDQLERESMGSWMEDLKVRRRSVSVSVEEVRMRREERREERREMMAAMGDDALLSICFVWFGFWRGFVCFGEALERKWWKKGNLFLGF